jgi:hypothetical protein
MLVLLAWLLTLFELLLVIVIILIFSFVADEYFEGAIFAAC